MRPQKRDVTKLPKWAQQRIQVLEMRLREAEKQLNPDPADADTFAEPFSALTTGNGLPLGKGTRVRFMLDQGTYDYVDAYVRGFQLIVHGSGVHSLAIVPHASNLVHVRNQDH